MQEQTPISDNNVYRLISRVAADLAKEGIAKTQKNSQGAGYNFRGIDDIYNAIGPLLAKHGLSVLPRTLSRESTERKSAQNKALFSVVVETEFDFVSAYDGSTHTAKMFGEAMDSGDKATNKAMSAAYKYALFQVFCIPTQGDNDADSPTHSVMAQPSQDRQKALDKFIEQHSQNLLAASSKGIKELQSTFFAIPASQAKSDFWEMHQSDLKQKAKEADGSKKEPQKTALTSTPPPPPQPAPQNPPSKAKIGVIE